MILKFDNQFKVRSINLDTFDFPEPKISSWSNLFGDGSESTVTVEAKTADGGRIELSSERVHRDDRRGAWDEAEAAVEEWMEDNKGNWLKEISRAATYVHEYNVKQAKECSEAIAISSAQSSGAAALLAAHEAQENDNDD